MTSAPTTAPASEPTQAAPSKLDRFVAKYREDHKHPVNHVLHVGVGWPLCALGVIVLPFRPWWTVGFFAAGYAFMWFGHFVFERNLPTIFRHPTTPFVMAWAVIRGLVDAARNLVAPGRARQGRSREPPLGGSAFLSQVPRAVRPIPHPS